MQEITGWESTICIRCALGRFPSPSEQCYKMGGLICTVDNANVAKYQACRFGEPPEHLLDK